MFGKRKWSQKRRPVIIQKVGRKENMCITGGKSHLYVMMKEKKKNGKRKEAGSKDKRKKQLTERGEGQRR